MGYSASTPIRNKKLQQRMLKFLRENMRPAHQINPEVWTHLWGCITPGVVGYHNGSSRSGDGSLKYNRSDGHVERAMTTNVLDKLLNADLVVTPSGDAYRVESLEPTGLVFLREKLKTAGYASDVEFGPLILSPFRKSQDDTYEPGVRVESEIIKSELSRLSKLWSAYQETP